MNKPIKYYGLKGNDKIIIVVPVDSGEIPTVDWFFNNYDIFGRGQCSVVEVSIKQLKTIGKSGEI